MKNVLRIRITLSKMLTKKTNKKNPIKYTINHRKAVNEMKKLQFDL